MVQFAFECDQPLADGYVCCVDWVVVNARFDVAIVVGPIGTNAGYARGGGEQKLLQDAVVFFACVWVV
jgi:hypothetical protein